jgi:hypothetical protein
MQLQAHGFDLMAQVEAFLRGVRGIQQCVSVLKENPSPAQQLKALHAVRTGASTLIEECAPFCETLGEVQTLTDVLTPERRVRSEVVRRERRRKLRPRLA